MADVSQARSRHAHRTLMACLHCREGKHRCDGTPPTELVDSSSRIATTRTPQGAVLERAANDHVLDLHTPAPIVPDPQSAVEQPRLAQPLNTIQKYGEDRCSGCKAGNHACIWLPKSRLGRPRKRARESKSDAGLDVDEHAPLQLSTSELGLDRATTSQETPWTSPLPPTTSPVQAEQEFQSLLSIFQSSARELQERQVFVPAPNSSANLQELYLDAFFNHAAHFCSVLGDSTRFKGKARELNIASTELQLDDFQQKQVQALSACVAVAVALGAHLCTDPDRASPQAKAELLSVARLRIQTCTFNPPATPITLHDSLISSVIHHLQAMIIIAHLEYGLGETARARAALDSARAVALYHQLQHLDKPPDYLEEFMTSNLSSIDTLADLAVPHIAPRLHAGLPALVVQADVMDDLRRVWWELCVLDAVLSVASGASTATCLLSTHATRDTQFPGGNTGADSFGSDKITTQTRVRAATILVECAQPCVNASRLVRLDALSTITSNMTIEAHHQWRTGATLSSREASLMAFVMLHAARIQLYRLAALPEISFRLTSCSFEVKQHPVLVPSDNNGVTSDGGAPIMNMSVALAREVSVPQATQKIVESADAIMDMLRNEHQRLPFEARHSLLAGHSPFLSCSQVAAAWGYTVAAAAMRTELDFDSDAHPVPGSETASNIIWRHRAVLSNLGAAMDSLQSISSLWPITAKMAEEVRACRAVVERTGSVGVLFE